MMVPSFFLLLNLVPKTKVYNYQVFLSNTTQWQDGFLCIDDRGPSFPFPGYVKNCPIIARFVIFKNAVYGENVTNHNFDFSQICEVKVEGTITLCTCIHALISAYTTAEKSSDFFRSVRENALDYFCLIWYDKDFLRIVTSLKMVLGKHS